MLLPIGQVLSERSLEIRRVLSAWLGLATASLSLAVLFTIPAALGGTSGAGTALASPTIARFLVGHIFFTLVIACTSFVVVLWMLAVRWLEAPRLPVLPAWIGFWLAVTGSLLAIVGTFGWWSNPVLTEYLPIVVEPGFVSGFGLFMAGMTVTTGCFIFAVTGAEIARMPLVPYGMLCAAAMMVATGLAGIATITRLFGDWFAFQLAWRRPYVLFQAIFWGPARLIQFVVIGAMFVAWILLMPHPGLEGRAERRGRIAFWALGLIGAMTLMVLYAVDPLALPKMRTLNTAIGYGQTLPVFFLMFVILRVGFQGGRGPGSPALALSMLLFSWGILIAVVGARQTSLAWVPSHYQAMIPGAVLIAFMGVTTDIIPLMGWRLPSRALAALEIYLYGGGILVVSLAQLWSALRGGERHGYFVSMPATGPAVLLWIGGIAAGLGALAFAANTLGALLRRAGLPDSGDAGDSTVALIGPSVSPHERQA